MNGRHVSATMLAVVLLSGRVVDRTTGQGLAHVRVATSSAHATTDASGRYVLSVPAGPTAIVLESEDVPAQHFTVTVGPRSTRRDFRACSTTLDYSCGAPAAPNAGGAG
jgi:hypothetical protein